MQSAEVLTIKRAVTYSHTIILSRACVMECLQPSVPPGRLETSRQASCCTCCRESLDEGPRSAAAVPGGRGLGHAPLAFLVQQLVVDLAIPLVGHLPRQQPLQKRSGWPAVLTHLVVRPIAVLVPLQRGRHQPSQVFL